MSADAVKATADAAWTEEPEIEIEADDPVSLTPISTASVRNVYEEPRPDPNPTVTPRSTQYAQPRGPHVTDENPSADHRGYYAEPAKAR